MNRSTEVFLADIVQWARIPGIACAISSATDEVQYWCAGHHSLRETARDVSRETIFDLASLTKVLTTHQWLLTLVSDKRLDLEAPISRYLTGVTPWLAQCPLWRLSNHTSGLAAHVEFFRDRGLNLLKGGDFSTESRRVINEIKSQEPAYKTGESQQYSDLGYILLAHICEVVDEPMSDALPKLYGHGRHMNSIHWRPSRLTQPDDVAGYAATEICPWRGKLIQGEVHDDNCWTMGGIAGHAGGFGNIEAVHAVARAWLGALNRQENPLNIHPTVVEKSRSKRYEFGDSTRTLGWDRTSLDASSSGSFFTPLSPGHLGFTGTSIWLDVEKDVAVTVLTNRVCPTRHHDTIKRVRPMIHNHLRGLIQR